MRAGATSDYLIGAAFLLWVLSACTAAGLVVVARRLAYLRGLVRGLAIFLVATAAVWAVHLLPALLGVLSAWTVGVAAALVLAGARLLPFRARTDPPAEPTREPDRGLSRLLAVTGVAVTTILFVAYLMSRSPVPMSMDAVGNHLPHVTRWIQTGSIWQLTAYTPDLSHATYPQNGNLLLLAVTLPWKSTFLTGYVPAVFLVAFGMAVHALARELGAPSSSSTLAATALVALPIVAVTALQEILLDAPMLAWGTIGVVFLLRAARSGDVDELLLAGCGLGLAFGTKWYAVPYVPVIYVVWLVARRRGGPGALRDATLLAGAIGLFGGIWLVRNWVLTGNPVHPARVAPFGVDLVDAPHDVARERFGFKVSDYLFDGGVWRDHLFPSYRAAFGLLGALLVVAAVAAVVKARDGGPRVIAAIGAASLAIAMLYVFVVPDTAFGPPGVPGLAVANSRYLVPALVGAAVLAAWLAGRLGGATPLLEALMLLCILEAGPQWAFEAANLADLIAATMLVGGLAAVLRALARPASFGRVRPVAAVVAGLAALAAGWVVWRGDWWSTYGIHDPAIALTQRVAPSHGRVAIAGETTGVSAVQPAFGRRLDNRVDYIGDFEEGILRRAQRDAFLRQLRTNRYDAVIVGTGIPSRPAGDQPEVEWAGEAGYRVRARSRYLVVLTPG